MAKNNAAQVWFILDLSAQSSYLLPSATSDNASAYIDALLQDTWLFVMDIYNQPERVRDEALYRRGVELVEKMQEQLNTMNESEAFRNDVLLAQCALIDHVVLNTASCDDNALWVYAPLQSVYLHTLYAGKNMNDRTRQLLREVSPDRRLLVLHQRAYALGLGRFETQQHQQAFNPVIESLNALVPKGARPLSASLIVERHPGVRGVLRYSRLVHITFALLLTAGLIAGLTSSLQHLLRSALPG